MTAEKMYSDFFDTTDADAAMRTLKSTPAKRVKKTKKPPATVTKRRKSSSEDENEGEKCISGLPISIRASLLNFLK